jgi:N-6 DNA Methylase
MSALKSEIRRQLENVIIEARDVAEKASRSALQKRGVDVAEPFSHFGPKERDIRNLLRARGRQVGDIRNADKTQTIDKLTQELAYEYWHRMLFSRFLAENHLLMHPDGVAVSLEECEELAKDADPPAPNGFVLAARYARAMLPQIFRSDDVLLDIDFAPEQRLALERLLANLPQEAFLSDDSLGWAYQFWQSTKKQEANKSGDKIDGRTLSAVTQLFTEHYMVQFLLHNTIGAWWCSLHGIEGPPGGFGVPIGKSPVEMEYLRWQEDGTPASGKFEGWPRTISQFKMLDPCCGSGHFLVAAFSLLVPLRMHDDGLTSTKACDAVLRENIFGLELDSRCTQIAAFALALAAWKYPDAGGYRPLPMLNIACSGQSVTEKKDEWLILANENSRLRDGMDRLYDLFQLAPDLGSLIDPRREKGDLYGASYAELQPLLAKALAEYANDADLAAVGIAAQGIARAAELLGGQYALVTTNVPYLGRGKQNDVMKDYLDSHYKEGRADLATAFVQRCLELCANGGSASLVTPQNWLFLRTYTKLRQKLLSEQKWNAVARLGSNAFQDMNWWAATTALVVISAESPTENHTLFGIDVSSNKDQGAKAGMLQGRIPTTSFQLNQSIQRDNPDAAIKLDEAGGQSFLSEYADCYQGISTGDNPRFVANFWEVLFPGAFTYLQSAPEEDGQFGGCEFVVKSQLLEEAFEQGTIRGRSAWNRQGLAMSQTGRLRFVRYMGKVFTNTTPVLVPKSEAFLPAICAFAEAGEFERQIRVANQKVSIDNGYVTKVPFDLAHWQGVASIKYPNGLPEPYSDDPTQWLFKGDIATSTDPLQVAVARLLVYRWPDHLEPDDAIDELADNDGILCLPGVRGEAAASERLLEVLQVAFGSNWSDSVLHKLLTDAGCKAGTTLEDWLRNQFFEQHSKRFQARPFIWHIWDGRKDGFSVLVNYHKLDHKALENLTYSYLSDWIKAQTKSDKAGADSRLGAAQELQAKLKLILAGEPPYDIFVRWKPLHEQAIGWNPDLNDGVRMNIRPFMEAGILRKNPNVKWGKDRGSEPKRDKDDYPWFWSGNEFIGERVNDKHYSNAEKQAARDRKKGAK